MAAQFESPFGGLAFRESRKRRRRLSERRRLFGRLASSHQLAESFRPGGGADSLAGEQPLLATCSAATPNSLAEQAKISMKIQFHITVAPESEPLVLDYQAAVDDLSPAPQAAPAPTSSPRKNSSGAASSQVAEQINEKLHRQNSSTRRRLQMLAMHNQLALDGARAAGEQPSRAAARLQPQRSGSIDSQAAPPPREAGARSSTISSGMQDEATLRFLASSDRTRLAAAGRGEAAAADESLGGSLRRLSLLSERLGPAAAPAVAARTQRENIYFKRDGQRFGHEFTLKLAVDRSYRCLLKVRPLIPLQAISVQGHQVAFVDCSSQPSASLSSSAPTSLLSLNQLNGGGGGGTNSSPPARAGHLSRGQADEHSRGQQQQRRKLGHAQTVAAAAAASQTSERLLSCSLSPSSASQLKQLLVKQQQHSQMMRQFAASHCSPSGSHLGSQLIYMFDWSASHFEVNKNKARTQVQTVLKFKNGQIVALPLQVKFYEPEKRQHLSWGSQLHFIDYDCAINSAGQINVDRVQYY